MSELFVDYSFSDPFFTVYTDICTPVLRAHPNIGVGLCVEGLDGEGEEVGGGDM